MAKLEYDELVQLLQDGAISASSASCLKATMRSLLPRMVRASRHRTLWKNPPSSFYDETEIDMMERPAE